MMNSPLMAEINEQCEKLQGQTAMFDNIRPLKIEYQINKAKCCVSSDVLFRTKESLIDFCETDDINVAALTKVAFYIFDRFSAQIT